VARFSIANELVSFCHTITPVITTVSDDASFCCHTWINLFWLPHGAKVFTGAEDHLQMESNRHSYDAASEFTIYFLDDPTFFRHVNSTAKLLFIKDIFFDLSLWFTVGVVYEKSILRYLQFFQNRVYCHVVSYDLAFHDGERAVMY
jgi:hypothetical protein